MEPATYVPTVADERYEDYTWDGHDAAHLLARPGIGEVKADRILADVDLDGDRTMASLGARQREHLEAAASAEA